MTSDIVDLYTKSDGLALAGMVRRREVTPLELVEAAISLIERHDKRLNAVVHRLYDRARAAAPGIDPALPFAGVPYLLKELGSMWRGAPLTNGSAWLRHVVAPLDDEIVTRIQRAGFLILGKTNSPEFGWSLATEPALYGPTRNPWADGVSPGGSSGGAAAAVAAGMVPLAEASDAAGSIRAPASCCGVVGLKPSRGRLTYFPAADLWHGGVYFFALSRTVRDTAAYLDAVAGAIAGEPYLPPVPSAPWLDLAAIEPKRLRIGFSVTPPNGDAIDPKIADAVRATATLLERLGHVVEEHDLALDGRAAWTVYAQNAAVHNASLVAAMTPLAGEPPREDQLEPATWALVQRGRSISAIEHLADLETLRDLGRKITADLLPYDVFLTPTLTQLPKPIGYSSQQEPDLDRYNARWSHGAFLFPFNIAGLPAISLPLHATEDGMPIGIQAVGRYGDEATILALATVLERESPWRDRRPPIFG